jgi:hypothetical protein
MTNVNEIWLPIPNYEGLYEISNYGRIKSFPNKTHKDYKIINPAYDKNGYLKCVLHKNNKNNYLRVHRLVMLAFVGESKLAVDHIDGNKENNHLSNLRYCTNRENCSYYYENKKDKSSKYVGVKHHRNKKWVARIWINKKLIYLGSFDTEEEAAKKYLEAKENIVNLGIK